MEVRPSNTKRKWEIPRPSLQWTRRQQI